MPRTRSNTVRIIGGRWRSRLLTFPDAEGLRPTPDRVRETLFNWLGQQLHGKRCLDLFAGSGALGFEALSRGAESVVMVENNRAVLRALENNARLLEAHNLSLHKGDALEFLRGAYSRYDVVFVDPPYGLGLEKKALALLPRLLAAGARVYVESDAGPAPPRGLDLLKQGRAGAVRFCLLGKEHDDQSGVPGNV